ncbi:MAG: threonine--tRNA ligase, partial [Acidimicrobiia bacterium]|nr:threonine--tRNA ligase [Acidimicrobiia bacterium]MCY4457395.1 His/Gly/Thr/Pro-type tRNA ligase C-terminal domain-containing protein [Acidimicrobiaceae bacterium]
PVQTLILPVAAVHQEYADSVAQRLGSAGVRVRVVSAVDPLGKRVRNAKVQKVPYILVVGDDDLRNDTVGVNRRGHNTPERDVPVSAITQQLAQEAAFPC